MNTPTALTLLIIVALIGYWRLPIRHPLVEHRRPTPCPACHAWRPVQDMTYIRHNSGTHVRVCEDCCRNLYAPFSSRKRSGEDKTK